MVAATWAAVKGSDFSFQLSAVSRNSEGMPFPLPLGIDSDN
jgi:hypothetical protein